MTRGAVRRGFESSQRVRREYLERCKAGARRREAGSKDFSAENTFDPTKNGVREAARDRIGG